MNINITILVVTRNRPDDLRRCLQSCVSQEGILEILVIDDASDGDCTINVMNEFPIARFVRSKKQRGLIAERNIGVKLADGDVVVSLDDDAVFSNTNIAALIGSEFQDSSVGAVAAPYVDCKFSDAVRYLAPNDKQCYIASEFRGTSFGVRRSSFLSVGGFPAYFFRQNEELFFCTKLYAVGKVVRVCRCAPILHYESPKRSSSMIVEYRLRNNILYVWQLVPMPYALPHVCVTVIRHFLRYTRNATTLAALFRGLYRGVEQSFKHPRAAITPRIYLDYRKLRSVTMRPQDL